MHYIFQTLSLNLRRVHVAGFIFFVLFSQVCWLSLHPKHVKLYDYISFAGKRVTYI